MKAPSGTARAAASSAGFETITGEIVPVELEAAFRAWSHPEHARRTRTGVLITAVLMAVFIGADFGFLGWSTRFVLLATARLAFLVVGLAWSPRMVTATPRALDRGLLVWSFAAIATVLSSLATRPAGFTPSVVTTACVALMSYTLLPNRFVVAVPIGIAVSVGHLALVSRGGLHGMPRAVIGLAYLLVNSTGAAVNSWLARLARSEFLRMRAADETHRERLAFLAATSHEIRSPLHTIVACIDLLSATELSREQQNLVDLVRASSEGMVGLLEEAVHQVRGDGTSPLVQLADFDLRAMLDETTALVRPRASVRSIRVTLRIGDSVPQFVRGDRARIRQILLNLAENALAHGAREHVELFAACSITDAGAPAVEVLIGVVDDGPGVDPAVREAIFEPFVRGASEPSRARGMGLGLTICDRLARAMKGTMSVDDAPSGGARFSLRLPLEVASRPAREVTKTNPREAKLAILVVEDDPVSGHLMSLLLERDGHVVTVATSAERALETIERQRFDAVLMDLRLPGMSGIEAIERIRARGVTAPIVAMSAHIAPADHDDLLRAGCLAVLPKPMDLARLRAVLDRVDPEPRDVAARASGAPILDETVLDLHIELLGAAKVARLLRMFVETSEATMAAILDAASSGDAAVIASQSHRLASAASSAGLAGCAEAAGQLETASRTGTGLDRDAVERLRHAYETSCATAIVRAELLERSAA